MFDRSYIAAVALMAALVGAGAGCQPKGGPADGDDRVADGEWPFVPAAVRVHPFTSIVRGDDGALTLEARLEFIDQVGDVTKGVGDLRFELYSEAATAQRAGRDKQLIVWEAPLTSLDHNRRHYDPITRTYIFRLKLAEPPLADLRLRLDVQITAPSGRRMTTSAPISAPAPAGDSPGPGK